MLPAFFGSDGSFPLQFAIIFVVIFAVLAALVLLIRRFTGRGLGSATKSGSLPRQPRLGIVDVYELDRQRQLILLRRDNVEHLLLVGGPNDVVVERNISRSPSARFAADEAVPEEDPVEAAPIFPPPPPREPPFPLREPTFPPREAALPGRETKVPEIVAEPRAIDKPSPTEPSVTMPFMAPPPPPSFEPQLPSAVPLRADRNDDTVTVPAAARREPQPARILRRTPPPLVTMKPDVASERSRALEPSSAGTHASPVVTTAEPDFEAAFAAALAQPVPVPTPAPEPTEPSKIGKVDDRILSDMARHLEEALRRPSGVTPAPSTVTVIPAVDLAQDPATAEAPAVSESALEPAADIPLPPPSVPQPIDDEPAEEPAEEP
ncbi:hypothetical protein, partial [uncultured Methylobacterium sp.]|uniref:hypothetical protein n=1 Tax=uncultured Methylobacterium sp. TaxID=157278 RepID=UPI0035CC74EB